MKTLILKRKSLPFKEYIKRSALETDYKTLIEEPTVIIDEDDGKIKIIYDQLLDFDTSDIVGALQGIRYDEGMRTRGLKSRSRIFGYRPRHEMRGDFCSVASLAKENPMQHAVIASLGPRLEEYYRKYDEVMYARHLKITGENVKKNYRINGGSVFTSGIINKNNPLKYHFDTGNFNEVYSCMIVFKKDVDGGFLSVPEYDIAFRLPNNSIFLFDGQGILHGVTPIRHTGMEAYRYSIVYYSLKRMWQCLEVDEELARFREKKTRRERLRMEKPMTEEEQIARQKNIEALKKRFGKQ